jgi:hypothetical protein
MPSCIMLCGGFPSIGISGIAWVKDILVMVMC